MGRPPLLVVTRLSSSSCRCCEKFRQEVVYGLSVASRSSYSLLESSARFQVVLRFLEVVDRHDVALGQRAHPSIALVHLMVYVGAFDFSLKIRLLGARYYETIHEDPGIRGNEVNLSFLWFSLMSKTASVLKDLYPN
ncbi:hypothetical protein DY000_02016843 [Brassica cretica]|uniref:Uncharacterized protein n=1 Tax=Brassica cretica TaxID=69181 RepID=A0ABQ7DBJ4_BRACR|nr:hypothetical protein DY000_02016843 [Brassica cretica]